MNVSAVLERSGYRVSKRNRAPTKIGRNHRVGRDEALEYFKQNFGVEVV